MGKGRAREGKEAGKGVQREGENGRVKEEGGGEGGWAGLGKGEDREGKYELCRRLL